MRRFPKKRMPGIGAEKNGNKARFYCPYSRNIQKVKELNVEAISSLICYDEDKHNG